MTKVMGVKALFVTSEVFDLYVSNPLLADETALVSYYVYPSYKDWKNRKINGAKVEYYERFQDSPYYREWDSLCTYAKPFSQESCHVYVLGKTDHYIESLVNIDDEYIVLYTYSHY